jgi:hypothetical protein
MENFFKPTITKIILLVLVFLYFFVFFIEITIAGLFSQNLKLFVFVMSFSYLIICFLSFLFNQLFDVRRLFRPKKSKIIIAIIIYFPLVVFPYYFWAYGVGFSDAGYFGKFSIAMYLTFLLLLVVAYFISGLLLVITDKIRNHLASKTK